MRDLIEKAALGTPGRHNVYILDEVHMLSRPAEAALLKTLEEPPPHVVFVLATTDPQRVSETIRSRTQHLRFHLVPPDTLSEHVRWVIADAGLELDDAAIDAALAQGAGSPRDTLSALELIASAGTLSSDAPPFDAFLDAMIEHDPGRALSAMAQAVNAGHEPRAIAEALIRHLRDAFLSLMAPDLVQLSGHQLEELTSRAKQVGPAALVRAIERLGEILVELRHAPDPRVLVEVGLVQITTPPPADGADLAAIAARLTKLEQAVASGAQDTAPVDPTTGRAALGGRARRAVATAPAESVTVAAPVAAVEDAALPDVGALDLETACKEWDGVVRPALKGLVRALYTPVDVVDVGGSTVTMATPNETHRTKCEQHRPAVEAEWSAATGRRVEIELGVSGEPVAAAAAPTDEPIDPDELVDAGPGPSALDRLAQAFPGAEVIDRKSER
jgi:DNA polymerase-3 subunit gamma/tau